MRRASDLLHRKRVKALQQAVERLPVQSRRAMLDGLGEGNIIAGAYSVGPAKCPGLAAYRRGARTGYSEFAKAWDRYARGRGIRRARRDDVAGPRARHGRARPRGGRRGARAARAGRRLGEPPTHVVNG
jgi:hypothetical protein